MWATVPAFIAAIVLALVGCGQDTPCECGTKYSESTLECSGNLRCEGNFELVGHSDLLSRGMNSALAIYGNYAYVGSRTDGPDHPDAGVLVVDISDPTAPAVVGQIGPPFEGVRGVTSRELRVVPDKHLLIVMNLRCTPELADCHFSLVDFPATGGMAETNNFKFYDISDPVNPVQIGFFDFGTHAATFDRTYEPHEFYTWRDPLNPDRTLMYVTTPLGPPALIVIDISDPTNPTQIAAWDAWDDVQVTAVRTMATRLHSLTVSDDGNVAYLAHQGLGFFMLDTSAVARGEPNPKMPLLTPFASRVDGSPPQFPGLHSAIKLPNRDTVLMVDEVYPVEIQRGCPWGWGWMVDITDPRAPSLYTKLVDRRKREYDTIGQLQLPANNPDGCESEQLQSRKSYTAHNPTVTEHLALISWYSGGMQAFDLEDPRYPVQAGAFYPIPIPTLDGNHPVEDPALGGDPVLMWSFPIVKDGLIYVVDIRNGLYVLRYNGRWSEEVSSLPFLEGNSNFR